MLEEEYSIETEEGIDGRWIAEVVDFPQLLMACGSTRQEAMANVTALAFRTIADRIGQSKIGTFRTSFKILEQPLR